MMQMLAYLEEFNMVSVAVRLTLAVILGGCIGLERATRRRAAGLRTFAIVCLGSALAMVTNQYLLISSGITGDPSRMAAQVISGIGFLGAGTIIVTGRSNVKGLTTAASLWTTATMGLALGAGYVYGGVLSFILIMVSIRVLQHISWHQEENNRILALSVELDKEKGLDVLLDYIKEKGFVIKTLEKQKQKAIKENDFILFIDMDLTKKMHHQDIINDLMKKEEITFIEEIRY